MRAVDAWRWRLAFPFDDEPPRGIPAEMSRFFYENVFAAIR